MAQQNEIKLSEKDGVTIMEIQGDITVFSEPFLKEAYQSANDLNAVNVMLVFDSSAYINSGGIAILIQLLAEARKRKQQVGITGLSEHFKKIFNMVGITRFARIYQTLEEGLNGLSPP
ncbi:MAG: STAS domain-containing protein [Syntrophobacteraceae bacterium]